MLLDDRLVALRRNLAAKDGIVRHRSVGAADDHRVVRDGNDPDLALSYLVDHVALGELVRGQIERNDGPFAGPDDSVVRRRLALRPIARRGLQKVREGHAQEVDVAQLWRAHVEQSDLLVLNIVAPDRKRSVVAHRDELDEGRPDERIDPDLVDGVVTVGPRLLRALLDDSRLQVPNGNCALTLHAGHDEVPVLVEGHRLDALLLARQPCDQSALLDIVEIRKSCSLWVLRSFGCGDHLHILGDCHAGELRARVSEHSLLSRFRLLDDELVVERKVGQAVSDIPEEVVVDAAEAVVSVDELLLQELLPDIDNAQVADEGARLDFNVDFLVQVAIVVVRQLSIGTLDVYSIW